jgi:hypothetical protein
VRGWPGAAMTILGWSCCDRYRSYTCCEGDNTEEDGMTEIERLRVERDALKAALERLLDNGEMPHPLSGREPTVRWEDVEYARRVLGGKESE